MANCTCAIWSKPWCHACLRQKHTKHLPRGTSCRGEFIFPIPKHQPKVRSIAVYHQTEFDFTPGPKRDHIAKPYRFIAIDVETANNNSHSICQIGLALVGFDGLITTKNHFVDPEEDFARFNTELHGIDTTTVQGAPNIVATVEQLRPLLEDHILIQHSNFDRRAFDAACKLNRIANLRSTWMDSVKIARRAWPELIGNGGHGLAHLKKVLNLQFKHHDAEEDARAAAQVVLHAERHTDEAFSDLAQKPGPNRPKKRSD